MIAFDLQCRAEGHRFEGWFGSSADYDGQREMGLIACPLCGDTRIEKAVMAPHVGRKGNQVARVPRGQSGEESMTTVPLANISEVPAELVQAIAKIADMQAKMLEKSDWVGDRFADEARAIHYGDAPDRIIHGSASIDDARELYEEGIAVAPLPLPVVPPDAKN